MQSANSLKEALNYWNTRDFLVEFQFIKEGIQDPTTKVIHSIVETKVVGTTKIRINSNSPHTIMVYAILLKNKEKGLFIDDSVYGSQAWIDNFRMVKRMVLHDL